MTTTQIEIPDYITRAKTLPDLALIATDLLKQAADSDLPIPDMARVSTGGQEVSLSFPGHQDTFRTLARWAERFGGTVTGEPYTHDDGRESVYCQARFPYLGVSVEAYAFIPADQTVSST
jgi:hypothetical protein